MAAYTKTAEVMNWEISAHPGVSHLLVKQVEKVDSVVADPTGTLPSLDDRNAFDGASTGWYQDPDSGDLRVKPGRSDRGLRETIAFSKG